MRVTDRKRHSTEEVCPLYTFGIERNLVIGSRKFTFPGYPCESVAIFKDYCPIANRNPALPTEVGNFFATLVDNNRIGALDAIAAVFHEERERQQGIVAAEMTTATPITEEMKQRARGALERLTGATVRLTCNVKPDLIGGAVTKIGSTVYDGSLRSQLEQLKRKMAEG